MIITTQKLDTTHKGLMSTSSMVSTIRKLLGTDIEMYCSWGTMGTYTKQMLKVYEITISIRD